MAREWLLPEPIHVPTALREAVGGYPLVAQLLARRGILDPHVARAYLDPAYYEAASPWSLDGMARAVQLLHDGIRRGQRVRVWGDLDADGQTATAVLVEALSAAGATVDYDLPRRDEGHGLRPRMVEDALRDGVSILVTCDTGVGEADVAESALAAGLTFIVTDHHDLPERPSPAHALVNPKQSPEDHPLRELAGVGVAYMLACALLEGGSHSAALDRMLDLVALGLVADVAVQQGDVRYLVQRGLAVLRATQRPGLQALIKAAGLEAAHLSEGEIGFQLGPRLNAAGRLADARSAVQLLLTRDAAEGAELAQSLEALNRDRRARTEAVQAAIEDLLARHPEYERDQPAIIVDGSGWEPGVLGLAAGELVRRYHRPAIVICHREGRPSVGSARSLDGIDIHSAILTQRELLVSEGGHPMAAGFSLERENVATFRVGLLQALKRIRPAPVEAPPLQVDAEVPWEEVNLELAQEVARLAPYGAGNPKPLLVAGGGTLVRVEDISHRTETPHRRLVLANDSGHTLQFTWFNAPQDLPPLGERLELAFTMRADYWRGRRRLSLEVADWRVFEDRALVGPALIEGREVIDWRTEPDAGPLLARLRERFGEELAVWAEDPGPRPEGTMNRAELAGQRATALAIWTPPCEPAALRAMLTALSPAEIYLLPPRPVRELSAQDIVRLVAGMVRAALNAYDGRLDTWRMAARIGERAATVMAALRGLEAAGVVALREEDGVLRAQVPAERTDSGAAGAPDGALCTGAERPRRGAERQAREAVAYQLCESRAYRQAYGEMHVAALFGHDS